MKKVSLALLAVVLAAILVIGSVLAADLSSPTLASPLGPAGQDGGDKGGGMPAAHEMSGREFGQAVSELAQSEPGAVAEHASNAGTKDDDDDGDIPEEDDASNTGSIYAASEMTATLSTSAAGGMPALHGMTAMNGTGGREFGQAVSELARSEPGAVAEHVRNRKGGSNAGGMPAAHGLSGREFGKAVSELAKSEPGAVAEHVKDSMNAAGGKGDK